MSEALDFLIDMSRTLGDLARDYVILGEGNTSVRADDESFWVKASGTLAAGGPRFLSAANVERIDRRPDELFRRKGFQ